MKNLGKITDPKDIITKEFLEEGIGTRVNTLEDNVAMAESDIETLQGDVQSLQTDNTATKAAVKTLQDTYVPNTRKVNNQSLDADITLTASDVGAPREEVDGNGFAIVSTTSGDVIWNYDTDNGNAVLGQTPTNEGRDGYVQTIYGKNGVNTTLGQYGVKLQNTDSTTYVEVGSSAVSNEIPSSGVKRKNPSRRSGSGFSQTSTAKAPETPIPIYPTKTRFFAELSRIFPKSV